VQITRVREDDLPALLPLVRAYCDFYEVAPTDAALLALSRALIADPEHEGVQLLARDRARRPLGFATVYWSWETLGAARLGVMNDLFVVPDARGHGVAEALIDACRAECRRHGATKLGWQTARDNRRAQRLYERVGANREEWIDYWLPAGSRAAEE
jgi:GNAT superfamily N-acetyltransferase